MEKETRQDQGFPGTGNSTSKGPEAKDRIIILEIDSQDNLSTFLRQKLPVDRL